MPNILIIGDYNPLTNHLIEKLHTEKWHIYTLISNKKLLKPLHVFEQYVFDYQSDSIKEIVASCRPDVVLFSGAYDSCYHWNSENNDTALSYTADLSNILIAVSLQGVRHFVYISSEIVFEDEYIVDIKENMPVSPNSYKGMAIAQGEDLALHYGQSAQMEVTVVRLSQMYGIPKDRSGCCDIFSRMCVEAIVNVRLRINAKRVFSGLCVKDAVEALFLLIQAPERKHHLYHISSMEEVTEDKVAQVIKTHCIQDVEVVDQTVGLKQRFILSNERFRSEFPLSLNCKWEEMIPSIITYINHHKKRFLQDGESIETNGDKSSFIRLLHKALPFVEGIVMFILVFLFSHGTIESRFFASIHFYLLYVLLFALMYGRQMAIFTSLLSAIGLTLSQVLHSTNVSFLIEADTYLQIVQIFLVGLSVGHLKDKFKETKDEMDEEVNFLKDQLKDISVINSSNAKIKDYYSDKLISSRESIGRIYGITSKLQKSEKGEILFAALDTIKEIMEIEGVSIYLISNKKYCRLVSSSDSKAASLGKTLLIDEYGVIFEILRSGQVYTNRTLDSSLPMMASSLFSDEGNMRIVIFLWNLPYEKMTLYYANLLTVVGALVYSVFVRDANYLDALAYRRYIPDTSILQDTAFEEMMSIYKRAEENGYAESCILFIERGNLSLKEVNDKIHPLLRETDYIGERPDGNLAILLTNTNKNESIHVKERLERENITTQLL